MKELPVHYSEKTTSNYLRFVIHHVRCNDKMDKNSQAVGVLQEFAIMSGNENT